MRFNKIYVWSPLILIMVMFSLVLAQDHTLNCSRFQLNIGEAGSKSMHYPADFDANNMNADGSISFMANDWKTIDGNLVSRAWEVDLFRHSSKKVVKYGYPSLLIDGADASMPAEYDEIDPNLVADQMVEMVYISSIGVRIVERAYSFSHADYEDFSIVHYEIINTGEADEFEGVDLPNQNLTNLHFIMNHWQIHPGNNIDSRHHPGTYSHWMDFYGDQPGDSLDIFYGWDGDDPKNGPYEDEGNPSADTGEFLSPFYGGVGLIHADNDVVDRSHDPEKYLAGFRTGQYDLNAITEDKMFQNLTTPGLFPPEIKPDVPGADPRTEQHPTVFMSIGPWDLAFGDTINVVMFYGVGTRSTLECREMGAKYKNGEITDEQKNEFLRWGKTDLFNEMSKAIRLWQNNMQIPGGANPIPPTMFTLQSGPGLVNLEWTRALDASSYNLYRALGVQDSTIFSLIQSGLTETQFVDEDVNKGFNYYYNLTAVDSEGKESSRYWLRTFRKSVVPFAAQGASLDDIRVVPNPFVYDQTARTNYVGQKDKIVFAGLPGPCKITIYTESGDLIDEIDHPGEEGTQEWFQVSKYNQYLSSGIYVYHVESTEGLGSMLGKFVIIR